MQEQASQKADTLDSGSYEIIKSRLVKHGNDLKTRLDRLNSERKNVFGSFETKLAGSERIITDNNCVPRDMAPVGTSFIFGYNVHMGLKTVTELQDVFAVYEYKELSFKKQTLDLISDEKFVNDFTELYKYYKNTFFAKFTVIEPYLYMIFQTGKSSFDVKAFKWLIEGQRLKYIDNRSDHEVKNSNNHEFSWVKARREDHREGRHPHISISDRVFVETIGGDLTIKVEDNTDTGKGIYSEPVDDKDQTLDDAEIFYAPVGHLILLKIRPYKENNFRHFIFNGKLQNVVRIDAIKDACILLPDKHGIIFPKGYYLQSGEYKIFDVPAESYVFERRIDSPNGEDFQYIFYSMETGLYLVYSYNLIEQSMDTPIVCSGYSHFGNGEMLVFKQEDEPRKNHMVQIWKTPYVGNNHIFETKNDSVLYNIGNKDIVRCMADCKVVYNLIQKGESYASIYLDIVKEAEHIVDSYFWLNKEEVFNISDVLKNVKEASASAVAEFEKVTRIRNSTQKQISSVEERTQKLLNDAEYGSFSNINEYVKLLTDLKVLRGEIVALKELRYADLNLVESLEAKVKEKNQAFSQKCISYLLLPEGLNPYEERVKNQQKRVEEVSKTSEGKELLEDMAETSGDLELLIDIVGSFKIEDATQTTEIIEHISSIYSLLNQAKAKLKTHMQELAAHEGTAKFNSQMKLLNQAVVNYLDISDTAEKCDEYLTKVMVQIEELEAKFADFEDFVLELSGKREELYNAFEAKKQMLMEKLNKKSASMMGAAQRIIKGIENRLQSFKTINEIHGYFAADMMIEKVRDLVDQLLALGENVKADEIQARLKTVKEEAVRQLKDKQDLFVDGKNVIKFGKHHFTVNTQPVDLAMVQKDGELYYHISGTDFWDRVLSGELDKYRHVWNQEVISENSDVYRSEYLAYKVFEAAANKEIKGIEGIETLGSFTEEQLLEFVRKFMESCYQEGYIKGVHDTDCVRILKALIELHTKIDLLIYSPSARALAQVFWNNYAGSGLKDRLRIRLKELAKVSMFFNTQADLKDFLPAVRNEMELCFTHMAFFDKELIPEASMYLCRELMRGDTFIIGMEAEALHNKFTEHLKSKKALNRFEESVEACSKDLEGAYYLVREWLLAVFKETGSTDGLEVMDEVIVLLIQRSYAANKVIRTKPRLAVSGLNGNHPVINKGEYILSYTTFIEKLRGYTTTVVPDFTAYQELKKELLQKYKEELRLDDFKPRVLSSFVRNKLIDEVYLPLIGDNLAKQIGAAGEQKRTDLMGMLLLISPPGYGKTTLVEYVASRLGIILVKINGPSLGHEVTSFDPDKANNAGAKEELRKLNMAFKMGNNVMIYLDDIQHCNPEFLQKFIPLCDGQRKIEGVYKGVGQSYELRGKKVAVVMAGNPYTESGDKFKIPDMLANRADVYNLGDMLSENREAFMLSFIENSLTSNPVLNKLAAKSQRDVYTLIQKAQDGSKEGLEFEGNYSVEEINEYLSVIEKLLKVRDVVMSINTEYIRSAAQAEEYRKEPAFKLQGSYRNMNKIAEKVLPVMNDSELDDLILSIYENDVQTLTTEAEANMLKWKEITGCLSSEDKLRWTEIKELFNKNKLVKGEDKMGQAVLKLSDFGEKLDTIKDVLSKGVENQSKNDTDSLKRLVYVMTQLKEILNLGVFKLIDQNKKKE